MAGGAVASFLESQRRGNVTVICIGASIVGSVFGITNSFVVQDVVGHSCTFGGFAVLILSCHSCAFSPVFIVDDWHFCTFRRVVLGATAGDPWGFLLIVVRLVVFVVFYGNRSKVVVIERNVRAGGGGRVRVVVQTISVGWVKLCM